MKGLTYKQVLEERIRILEKEYDKLSKTYYKQRKIHQWSMFTLTLLYCVIFFIIINNLKQ